MDSPSPAIRRLPAETLIEIFSYMCSTTEAESLCIYKQYRESALSCPPLVFAQVSRRWRKVAFSCPLLWTSINVDVFRPKRDFNVVLAICLRNSGNLPLAVSISADRDSEIEDEGRGKCLGDKGVAMLDMILAQSFRIEDLTITNSNLDNYIPHAPQHTFPLLRRFKTYYRRERNEESWFGRFLTEAPLLRSSPPSGSEIPLPLPYNRLTHVTIMSVEVEDLCNILQMCPKLERLEAEVTISSQPNPPGISRPLELPSLQYFTLHVGLDDVYHVFLPRPIEAPNLYQIVANYSCGYVGGPFPSGLQWPCPSFTSMLRSCSSTLRKLSIYLPLKELDGSAAYQILELSPNLTHLEVALWDDTAGFTDALVSALTVVGDPGQASFIPMPSLTSLEVMVDPTTVLAPSRDCALAHLIVSMMSSRSKRRILDREIFLNPSLAATNATFDFQQSSWRLANNDQSMPGHSDESSHRFLEIIDAVRLDSDMSLCVLVGRRSRIEQ